MVIDTHVYYWYCVGDGSLHAVVREAIEADPSRVWVPSVVCWELAMLVERGKLVMPGNNPMQTLVRDLQRSGLSEAPLTSEIAVLSRTLPFQHSDPADRFIAATAVSMGLPLATSDDWLRALPFLDLAY